MSKLVKFGQGLLFFLIWIVILIPQHKTGGRHVLSNQVIFALAGLILVVGTFIWIYLKKSRNPRICETVETNKIKPIVKNENLLLLIVSGILLLIQLILSWEIAFRTSWDPGAVAYGAHYVAYKDIDGMRDMASYFSQCPNNLFITFVYSIVYRINLQFGILSNEGLLLIILQCVISTVTAAITYKVARFFMSIKLAWCVYGFYVFLVGTSPWLVIAYSDSTGLIFPIAIFYLYLQWKKIIKNTNKVLSMKACLCFAGIVVVSIVGYELKPMAIFVLLAILIVECFSLFGEKGLMLKSKMKAILIYLLILISCGSITIGICNGAIKSMGYDINEEAAFGVPHYFMIGFNQETYGGFSQTDMAFSASIERKSDRNRINIENGIKRIQGYGPTGLLEFELYKNAKIYTDGVFGFGSLSDGFFEEIYPERDSIICPILRTLYYNPNDGGVHPYSYHALLRTLIWFMVLIGGLFPIFAKKKYDDKMQVMVVAILGLIVYEMIFEAHPRYLFTYVPFFIVLAVMGFEQIQEICFARYKSFVNFEDKNK